MSGSIEELPSGRFRVRIRSGGARSTIGPYDTREEAERMRDAAIVAITADEGVPAAGSTLRGYGERWLDRRETHDRLRNAVKDRVTWKNHVATAPFADWPLANITKRDVRDWLAALAKKRAREVVPGGRRGAQATRASRRTLSRETISAALRLLRRCLGDAAEDGLVAVNVAADVRKPKAAQTAETWTHLSADEIERVLSCEQIPEPLRLLYAFAIYQGLRAGEMWALQWGDVSLDASRPTVRVARSHNGPTKSGRVRTIPLLAPARAALERLRVLAGGDPGADALVFPALRGGRRGRGTDAEWSDRVDRNAPSKDEAGRAVAREKRVRLGWATVAGVTRKVRFHDLRHTCASHLVMGTWGKAWSLAEVCAFLRHSSITVTQRYAHLSPEHLHAAAAVTAVASAAVPPSSGGDGAAGPRVAHAEASEAVENEKSPGISQGTPGGNRTPDPRLRRSLPSAGSTSTYTPSWAIRGPVEAHARAVLESLAAGVVDRGAVEALTAGVLEAPEVRLALAVREGGPHAVRRAIELAEFLLAGAPGDRGARETG